MNTTRTTQQGSVILEALISILLFSIGILAIIGLQAASINNTAAAKYRTDASLLVNQVIGQMWVSNKATLATDFSSPDGAGYLTWADTVTAAMPGVAASPLYAPTISFNGNTATITVYWQAPNETTHHEYSATAVITD